MGSGARDGGFCSYKDLALTCVTDPAADWSIYYRELSGKAGLMQSIVLRCAANSLLRFSSLGVLPNEVEAGPDLPPDRDGKVEYGFKRGMDEKGLANQGIDTDTMILEHREACFQWAKAR